MTAAARSWTPINGADITARQRASRWGGLFKKKKSRLPVAAFRILVDGDDDRPWTADSANLLMAATPKRCAASSLTIEASNEQNFIHF